MMNSRIIRNTFYAQLAAYVASALTSTLGSFTDGVIIGRFLGVDSIAAFGIVSPLIVVFSLAGSIVSTGARNRFVRLVGSGDIKEAQGVFSLACVLGVGIATLMMLVICLFATPITRLLGATGSVAYLLPKAKDYLIGTAIGLPARNAMWILWAFMPIDNDRDLPLIAAAVMTFINTILDLVVVFVIHGDTFEMGIVTTISYTVAMFVLLTHFLKKNIILRFSFTHIPWRESWKLLSQGVSVGVCRLANMLRCAFMNHLLAATASAFALAAYSVHRQADSLLNPLTIGMADTVAVLAGVLMGGEDRPMMKRVLITSVQSTFFLTAGMAVLTWVLAPQFASLYVRNEPEALRLSIIATRCYAAGLPLYGLNLIYMNYLQGIGRSKHASIAGLMLESGFLIIAAAAMVRRFGPNAVWYSFPVAQLLMLMYYSRLINTERRVMKIQSKEFWDRVLLLPDSFDVPEADRMDRSITTMDEVTDLSNAVWRFCDAHGCDPRRRYLMSLSVEEMAGNVIEHGFTKDKKAHSIDVRVLKKDNDYLIRIRDDCLVFDPVKQLSLYSSQDPAHHMGLRMIINTAKEVQYTCIMKLNNLLIKV